jgi:uncharacterized protein YdcH (DUF465 family)
MFEKDKLQAHLEELVKKHRKLDVEISNLSTHHISAELRQLKTQKLWYKDEIHRIQRKLEGLNGS